MVDTDGDGVISFADLNDPANAVAAPADVNGNGFADGADLISDARWANDMDEDDFDTNPATIVDDLIGWDFFNNTNDPRGSTTHSSCSAGHDTREAAPVGRRVNPDLTPTPLSPHHKVDDVAGRLGVAEVGDRDVGDRNRGLLLQHQDAFVLK